MSIFVVVVVNRLAAIFVNPSLQFVEEYKMNNNYVLYICAECSTNVRVDIKLGIISFYVYTSVQCTDLVRTDWRSHEEYS